MFGADSKLDARTFYSETNRQENGMPSEALGEAIHHHRVPSSPSRSAVMGLHLLRSCAILIQMPYIIPVHSVMLSVHVNRCLLLLRFPLIFPSSSNLWMPSLLITYLQNELAFFLLSCLLAVFRMHHAENFLIAVSFFP